MGFRKLSLTFRDGTLLRGPVGFVFIVFGVSLGFGLGLRGVH